MVKLTPPMGWNSWNTFGEHINETMIKETADSMVENGLLECGYEYLNRKLPNVGDYVTTDDGLKGEVHSVNVLRQLVKVLIENNDEKEIREYKVEQLRFKKRHRKEKQDDVTDAELKELEKLEKQEGRSKLDDN